MHTALLSGSPILDVDLTLVIYAGVFFVIFFMLRALVFQPMMELFDAREEAIDGAKKKAKKLEKRAEEKLASFEQQMAKVRVEAGGERDKLRAESKRLEQKLTAKVKRETDEMMAKANEEMQRAGKKARAQIAAQSPKLASQIAEKLLGREVNG